MKTIIIGMGEVGKALAEVLDCYSPAAADLGYAERGVFEIMHICFPYSDGFKAEVANYALRYRAKHIVIHSTVPVGTSRALNAIHSPIRGIHPRLADGIRTFVKFLGGEDASRVADYFRRAGLRVMLFDAQETTELGKLLETESYRVNIEFAHRAKKLCREHNVSFHEAYTLQAQTYNDGYTKLGHPEYVRPVLQAIDGPIGGHCVLNNKELLCQSRAGQ